MDTYAASLTAVSAPLLIVQGVPPELRPSSTLQRRPRTTTTSATTDEIHTYGVQIPIERELEDISSDNPCLPTLLQTLERCNVRDQVWWQGQNQNVTGKSGNSSATYKGMWFNIKYADHSKSPEVIVKGSNSTLSPYDEKSQFYDTLLPLQWISKYYDYSPTVFLSFYEVNSDASFDDVLISEINRIKLRFSNTMIKYVAVLINTNVNGNNSTQNERIQTLLTRINMNANSLFLINGGTDDASKREQMTFMRKLLVGLKQYSNDFFDLQASKLKKRSIKSDQYSEMLFSARNLVKMAFFEQFKGVTDYSTKLLEYAYDRLLQVLRSQAEAQAQTQLQAQSKKKVKEMYSQTRGWLDVICLHIVRSCIALGDCNVAYRKFVFHVEKAQELDKENVTANWIANQYTWLAELVEGIVHTQIQGQGTATDVNIIPLDWVLMPTPGDNGVATVGVGAGGSGAAGAKFNSFNMPQNGFIFVQAATWRARALQECDGEDNRILLLNGALDAFNAASNTRFARIESSVYILLGDVYFQKRHLSMAVNNYYAGLSVYRQEGWMRVVSVVLRKILDCYVGMSRVIEASTVYIEMCCMSYEWMTKVQVSEMRGYLMKAREKIESLDLMCDDSEMVSEESEGSRDLEADADSNANANAVAATAETVVSDGSVLDSGRVAFVKEGMFDGVANVRSFENVMNDGVDIQLVLTCRGSGNGNGDGDCAFIEQLELTHMEVEIASDGDGDGEGDGEEGSTAEYFKVVKIINDSNDTASSSNANNGVNVVRVSCNDGSKAKETVHCGIPSSNSSSTSKWPQPLVFQMHCMRKIIGRFHVSRVRVSGTLNGIGFNTVVNVTGGIEGGRYCHWLGTDDRIAVRYPGNAFRVNPRMPLLMCKLEYEGRVFNGRRAIVRAVIRNEDDEAVVRVVMRGNAVMKTSNGVRMEVPCHIVERTDNDDELNPGEERTIECIAELPQVTGLPVQGAVDVDADEDIDTISVAGARCNVRLKFAYTLVNQGGVTVSDVKDAVFDVFEFIEWHTQLRADVRGIIAPTGKAPHTRVWVFTTRMKNASPEDIVVTGCKYKVRGNHEKSVVLKIQEEESGDSIGDVWPAGGERVQRVSLEVSAGGGGGVTSGVIRSVPIELQCVLTYHVSGTHGNTDGDAVTERYVVDMYRASLPHSDPRLLVKVDEQTADEVTLSYILENPTDRAFQYQSTLSNSGTPSVEIVDYVKSRVVTLPAFSTVVMRQRYLIKEKRRPLQLPEFTLYDRQYQVFVRANAADERDRLRVVDGGVCFLLSK